MQTDGPQTRADTRLRALNAQEGSREQREKTGGMRARNGDFGRGVLKRPRRETAPTLAFRAKKIPTDKGWDFKLWWWNTELNLKPLFKHLPPVCRRLHNSPNKGFVLRSFGRRHKGTQIRSHIELTRPHDLDSWICNHFIPMRNPTSSTCHCKLRRKHR